MFCYEGHASPVTSLCYSPSGRYLVSCSDIGERAIRVWLAGMPLYDREPADLGLRLRWTRSGLIKRVKANTEPSAMEFFLSRQEDREIRESSDESEGEKVGSSQVGQHLLYFCIFSSFDSSNAQNRACARGRDQKRRTSNSQNGQFREELLLKFAALCQIRLTTTNCRLP